MCVVFGTSEEMMQIKPSIANSKRYVNTITQTASKVPPGKGQSSNFSARGFSTLGGALDALKFQCAQRDSLSELFH